MEGGLKHELMKKVGPLPLAAWLALGGGGILLFLHARASSTGATGVPTGNTSGAPSVDTTGAAGSGGDAGGLDLGGGGAVLPPAGTISDAGPLPPQDYTQQFSDLEGQLAALEIANDQAIGANARNTDPTVPASAPAQGKVSSATAGGGATLSDANSTGGYGGGGVLDTPTGSDFAPASQLDSIAAAVKSSSSPIQVDNVTPFSKVVKSVNAPPPPNTSPSEYFTYRADAEDAARAGGGAVHFSTGKGYYIAA